MPAEQRARRVDELLERIAFIADLNDDKQQRDKLIKPLADELWAITQDQWKNGELDHLHEGV